MSNRRRGNKCVTLEPSGSFARHPLRPHQLVSRVTCTEDTIVLPAAQRRPKRNPSRPDQCRVTQPARSLRRLVGTFVTSNGGRRYGFQPNHS
jgi:hypothetical protein